jgi:HSP20 family protein
MAEETKKQEEAKPEKPSEGEITVSESKTPAGPFARLADVEREVERAFEGFFDRGWLRPSRWDLPAFRGLGELPALKGAFEGKTPKVNVIDRDDEVVVEAELPGVAKTDVDVSIAENTVTIKASTSKEEEEKAEEGQYHRREISRGYFSRTLPLPSAVNEAQAKATFTDGLLTLTIPKAEQAKRRKISVD